MSWWTAGGASGIVAAYQPVAASSLANSYVNLANPGTYDAAPGVAPTWAYGTGWTFNGSTQYLTTGVVPASDQTWSALVRFTGGAQNTGALFGVVSATSSRYFVIWPDWTDNKIYYNNGGATLGVTPGMNSGVAGFAGNKGYRDGIADPGTNSAGSGTITGGVYIGRLNYTTPYYWLGNIQALAIYSGTLTAAQMLAVTTAMNALPVAAGDAAISRPFSPALRGAFG